MSLPRRAVAFCLLTSLTACGASSSAGASDAGPSGGATAAAGHLLYFTSDEYLAAVDTRVAGYPIHIIDEADFPWSPLRAPMATATLPCGTFDVATGTVRSIGAAAMLFADDHDLRAATDPEVPGDAPIVTSVVKELGAPISRIHVLADYARTTDSTAVLDLENGEHVFVHLTNRSRKTYPGEFLGGLRDVRTGASFGSLAFEPMSGAVRIVDADGDATVLGFATSAVWMADSDSHAYVALDDSIHAFDKINRTLRDLKIDIARFMDILGTRVFPRSATIGDDLLIAGPMISRRTAIRIDPTGRETVLLTESSRSGFGLAIAGSRVILVGGRILSVDATSGGDPILISADGSLAATSGDLLFLNETEASSGLPRARVVRSNGTAVATFDGALFTGEDERNESLRDQRELSSVFLLRGVRSFRHEFAELLALDPTSGAVQRSIGIVPAGVAFFRLSDWPGPARLATTTMDIRTPPSAPSITQVALIETSPNPRMVLLPREPGLHSRALDF